MDARMRKRLSHRGARCPGAKSGRRIAAIITG
jgi:hypothetical protein